MIVPEIKWFDSPDLERNKTPDDPCSCSVFIEVGIGPKGEDSSEIFSFTAITPKAMMAFEGTHWGRGYLILDQFSWGAIDRALSKLLLHCWGENWQVVTAKLNKELHWEFENYQKFI